MMKHSYKMFMDTVGIVLLLFLMIIKLHIVKPSFSLLLMENLDRLIFKLGIMVRVITALPYISYFIRVSSQEG